MKVDLHWTEAMKLTGTEGSHAVAMDAKPPIGQGTAMTPKELVAAGLGGCTAMDVIALLKKHKQPFKSLDLAVDIESSTSGHPVVFTKAEVIFRVTGEVNPEILKEAVILSQTKYCGVSAMLSKALPIFFKIILNEEIIHEGKAQFDFNPMP